MRRALMVGLVLACGCATTHSAQDRAVRDSGEEIVARCRLVGPLTGESRYDPRNPVLDETKSTGPTRVVWINPPSGSLVRTPEGLIYRCDTRL